MLAESSLLCSPCKCSVSFVTLPTGLLLLSPPALLPVPLALEEWNLFELDAASVECKSQNPAEGQQ